MPTPSILESPRIPPVCSLEQVRSFFLAWPVSDILVGSGMPRVKRAAGNGVYRPELD